MLTVTFKRVVILHVQMHLLYDNLVLAYNVHWPSAGVDIKCAKIVK